MSYVDNWLLLLRLGEDSAVAEVNHALSIIDVREQQFRLLDGSGWGGTKYPECDVYAMAANHLSKDDVLQAVRGVAWIDPEMCSLALSPQEGGWKFWTLDQLPSPTP
jgi:hypothetical protein